MTQLGNINSPVPITANQLQDGLITETKISNNAVSSSKLASSISIDTLQTNDLTASRILAGDDVSSIAANLKWAAPSDFYIENTGLSTVTTIHKKMKRCLLYANGTVNYYLDPNDSTKKADGSSATLTGGDGYVMVEIPKFYYSYARTNNVITWKISETQLDSSYVLHPAFTKNGAEVNHRYYSAYDACVYDASLDSYIAGLNLDNATSLVNTGEDKLASVSGIYPMVGLTRSEFRTLARNNGTGWEQADFWMVSAIQLLYLIEYGTFNSQAVLGNGNTGGGYLDSSSSQSDSPHTIAGASNSIGNGSTNPTTGASSNNKPGTAFMTYRGIENFYGNCWNWVDGFNVLADYQAWIAATSNGSLYVDNVSTGLTNIGTLPSNSGNWVTDLLNHSGSFLPSVASGGSSSTFITDQFFIATGNRVALFGGNATDGLNAGGFCWALSLASSDRLRSFGARVIF
jgi:hypothetical protein